MMMMKEDPPFKANSYQTKMMKMSNLLSSVKTNGTMQVRSKGIKNYL